MISRHHGPGAAPVSRLDLACPALQLLRRSAEPGPGAPLAAVKLKPRRTPRPNLGLACSTRAPRLECARAQRSGVGGFTRLAPELSADLQASIADRIAPQARLALAGRR